MSALMGQPQEKPRSRMPRIAEAAVERARLSVVPRSTRVARVPFVALVSLLLITGVAGLLLFNTHMQQASFTTTALEEQATVLDAREQSLKMELEKARDPQRLAVAAREIGMVPPANPAFIRLSDGAVLGNPTPALATDAVRIRPLPTRKPKNLRPDPVIAEVPRVQGQDRVAAGADDDPGAELSPAQRRRDSDRQQGGGR